MKIILIETILVCFVTLFSGYYCIDFWKALQNESNARMEKFIKSWGYTVFVAIAGFVVVTMVSIIATMESSDIYLYGVCILLANILMLAFALGDDPNVMPSPLAIATTNIGWLMGKGIVIGQWWPTIIAVSLLCVGILYRYLYKKRENHLLYIG